MATKNDTQRRPDPEPEKTDPSRRAAPETADNENTNHDGTEGGAPGRQDQGSQEDRQGGAGSSQVTRLGGRRG